MAGTYKPSISEIKVLENSGGKTLYVTWTFTEKRLDTEKNKVVNQLDHYVVCWEYATRKSKSVWFEGSTSNVEQGKPKNSQYSIPEVAERIRCYVTPVAKTHKVKVTKDKKTTEKDVAYWTGTKSDTVEYTIPEAVVDRTPADISTPSLSVEKYTLTASLENISDSNTPFVEFQIIKDNTTKFDQARVTVKRGYAAYSCTVKPGVSYTVRARGVNTLLSEGTVVSLNTRINELQRELNHQLSNLMNLAAENKKTASVYERQAENLREVYNTRIRIFEQELSDNQDKSVYGKWSAYGPEGGVSTIPDAPEITSLEVKKTNSSDSSAEIQITFTNCKTAIDYEVEYTSAKRWFDSSPENVSSTTVDSVVHHAEIMVDLGSTKFFRVRAHNDSGYSAWSDIESIVAGTKPSPPTTWSETTTAVFGGSVNLYWQHNSRDTSTQKYAEFRYSINGREPTTISITGSTSYKKIDLTDALLESGGVITWDVRTMGAYPDWSDWSTKRSVTVYSPPSLSLRITSGVGNETEGTIVTGLPIAIEAEASPVSQKAQTLSLSIVSRNRYTTVDSVGRTIVVAKGEELFSRVYDLTSNFYLATLSAQDIDLQNGNRYQLIGRVSMNSGLAVTKKVNFRVIWDEIAFAPNAEIYVDGGYLSATIRPFCLRDAPDDADEDYVPPVVQGVTLAVYRREFDGRFTEIQSGIDNTKNVSIVDPHPALDYARYRIVATMTNTGAVAYTDIPDIPIQEKSIIIQWAEEWDTYEVDEYESGDMTDIPIESKITTSMIRLPYNIDVSSNYDMDTELVEYIGREHPVSYYGTQTGESATWNTEIPADDFETLYQIRRLAIYKGDVYVREPSGSGYWAHIKVSFHLNHNELTIPVSFDITRVEGGV